MAPVRDVYLLDVYLLGGGGINLDISLYVIFTRRWGV